MGSENWTSLEFSHLLDECASFIEATLTLFKDPAPTGVKVEWKEVTTAAESIAKHATTTGILCNAKVSKQEGIANVQSYIQALQGFLLLCHGSTVGAEGTFLNYVELAVKGVANASMDLLKGVIAKAGTSSRQDIPVLVGRVWEACEAVRRTPSTNHVAIGRRLTAVAVSLKDVLRELHEFREGASKCGYANNVSGEVSSSDEDEISEEVTAAEIKVVLLAKEFVSALLSLVKQLLYLVADTSNSAQQWEKVLMLCKELGSGVDDLGASLYPPQETEVLQQTVAEIGRLIEDLSSEVNSMVGTMSDEYLSSLNACKKGIISLSRLLTVPSDVQ